MLVSLLVLILVVGTAFLSTYSIADTLGEESHYHNELFAHELVELTRTGRITADLQSELRARRLAYLIIRTADGQVLEARNPKAAPLISSEVTLEKRGIRVALASSDERVEQEALEAVGRQLALVVPLALVIWGVSLFILKRAVRPLQILQQETSRLSRLDPDQKVEQATPELKRLAESRDEAGVLAHSFLAMESHLDATMQKLRSSVATSERLQTELRVGRELQQGMLPGPIPDNDSFELVTRLIPAKEMSGDFYHHFPLADRWVLAVGDVSGKGVSAALMMAVAQTMIRHLASECASLSEAVARLNDHLAQDNPMAYFLTLFAAVYDPRTGELEYVTAGHPSPQTCSQNGEVSSLAATGGMGLGVVEGQTFKSERYRLAQGEVLLAFTDGVTEATRPDGELFGERVSETLAEASGTSAAMIAETLVRMVQQFEGSEHLTDDLTLLVLRRC